MKSKILMFVVVVGAVVGLSGCGNPDAAEKALKMVGETCKGKLSTEARVSGTSTEFVIRCDDAIWKDTPSDKKK